ncbi:MAG: MazG nucleotide pyrophosphohydrolase domain-containing protein, partial [Pseudomonadota bacterium]
MRALKLQKRAARVGFDWTEIDDVLAKVGEEIGELAQARTSQSSEKIAEEYGDLLFILVNVGRHLKVDPEEALRAANAKFTRRFQHIEGRLAEAGRTPRDSDLEEMDALWDEAKALGK